VVRNAWPGWELANFNNAADGRVPIDVAIADMDNNGQNDVVVVMADPSTVSYFTPGADNRLHWVEQSIFTLSQADFGLINVADFDKDTDLDVALPIDSTQSDALDRVVWLVNPTKGGVAGAP